MTGESRHLAGSRTFNRIALFVLSFFLLWTAAWLLHNLLARTVCPALSVSGHGNLLYWAAAKIVVWVAFPFLYAMAVLRPKSPRTFLGLQNARKGLLAGLLAGLVWGVASLCFQGSFTPHFVPTLTFFWVVTGTPIAEEFTFRGVILPGLQQSGMSFRQANALTAILFVLIHCVGWWFQGTLTANLASTVVVAVLVVSLAAGWLRQKTASLYSAIALHAINNLFSSLR